MSRRFFFVSLGILALSVAYHLGATVASADWNHAAPGQVVGLANLGGTTWKLVDSAGNSVVVDATAGSWLPDSGPYLPAGVGVSDVKFFDGSDSGVILITNSDEVWTTAGGGGWHSLGVYPGAPTPTKSTSWGAVKGKGGK